MRHPLYWKATVLRQPVCRMKNMTGSCRIQASILWMKKHAGHFSSPLIRTEAPPIYRKHPGTDAVM